MTLLANRSNLRTQRLKIDPSGSVWGDSTLNAFLNEGQREVLNDTDVNWPFAETTGYIIPVETGLNEYLATSDNDPANFLSPQVKQFIRFRGSNGQDMRTTVWPEFNSSNGTIPSRYADYAERLFFNVGFENNATFTTLHTMDTVGGNGTWAAANAETINVATDAVDFKQGTGSIKFDIDVDLSTDNFAEIENSTLAAVDISTYDLNESGILMWVYMPEVVNTNEVSVYFGSSATDYAKVRVYKQDVQGKAFSVGWNRIFVPSARREIVGTPNFTSIDYLKVRVGYSSTQTDQTDYRVDIIQIVDRYVQYQYSRSADDMEVDTDESVVPAQYQFVFELYAEWRAWSSLSGRENRATQAFQEYQRALGKMKKELLWNDLTYYQMRPDRSSYPDLLRYTRS